MLTKRIEPNVTIFFFFIFVVFLIRLLFNFYLNLPLHFDEAQYWDWSQNLDWGYFSKPPALAFFIRVITEICGNGENCIKSLSPLMHSLTSVIIFYSVYNLTKCFTKSLLGALLYLFMPGITFSSFIISTDVPLMLFSSLTALILIKIYTLNKPNYIYFFFLSLSLAIGILSKYATFYIILCFILSSIIFKDCRNIFLKKEFAITILITMIFIFPNIIWNYKNEFVTFSHTASNANLNNIKINLINGFVFIFSQITIFGIIPVFYLFKKYIFLKKPDALQKIFFICFIFPILIVFILAIFSRANANWAVVGYPFGCILLPTLCKVKIRFFRNILLINQILFSFTLLSLAIFLPMMKLDPFSRIKHIIPLSELIKKELITRNNISLMADDREDYAHLLYYLKDLDIKKAKWNGDKTINDHYELTTHQNDLIGKDILFVTRTRPTPVMIKKKQFI